MFKILLLPWSQNLDCKCQKIANEITEKPEMAGKPKNGQKSKKAENSRK